MNEHRPSQISTTNLSKGRYWIGNTFRGLLLVANICAGGLVAIMCKLGVSDPGPWGLEWPLIVEAVLWGVLGLWLIVSGILLVCHKRPKCWTVGTLTHMGAGCGFFVLVAAMRYEAEYIAVRYPGHMAMQLQGAAGLFSYFLTILGIVWLTAAAVLYGFYRSERKYFRTEVQSLHTGSDTPE